MHIIDVESYVESFNEACIYAYYLVKQRAGVVALGDIAAVVDDVDTAEHRRIFRDALPTIVVSELQSFEAAKRTEDLDWGWSPGVLQSHAISVTSVLAEAKDQERHVSGPANQARPK